MRETIKNAREKIQRLADLACGATPTICDHVRGHRGAVLAVASINFLDHRLATIAARKIEIDVRPAFAALIQESFKHQIVADRIDRRDPEAITNRTVRRAATALDHDVVLTAEINDVPDNQEISGKSEFDDECQFFLKLAFHFCAYRGVTLLRAEPDDRPQKRIHTVTGRHRILRKLITEIFQREPQPLCYSRP